MSIHLSFRGPEGIRLAHFQLRAMHAVCRPSTIDIPRHFTHKPHHRMLVYVVQLDQSEHVVQSWADSTDPLSFSVPFHPKVFQ